jgi:hypothetical protein
MPAFYYAPIAEFLRASATEVTGTLNTAYAREGFATQHTTQITAWVNDIQRLQATFSVLTERTPRALSWNLILEFPIPRKEKRIDVVLLAGSTVVILELKSQNVDAGSVQQAEEYALLLHYFHRPSQQRRIVTLVVSPKPDRLRESQMFLPICEAPAYWVAPVEVVSWKSLIDRLIQLSGAIVNDPIEVHDWLNGEYHPVPSIIEAARSLQSGLSVREIAHSRAARHDVDKLTRFIHSVVDDTRVKGGYSICFVTGVPGSGKTLVGLNMALATFDSRESIHFMSGTGPLVMVLQSVLSRHHQESTGARALDARLYAKTLIENVHVFAKHYSEVDKERPPSNHVIIFDEAQRAWNQEQNFRKFRRPYSEPEMLISIMERHHDWAVVVALVGGGQEINSGEAGIEEWGRALSAASKPWRVFASPAAIEGGASVAGARLFDDEAGSTLELHRELQLHLDVAVRSLNSELYSHWVNHVVNGEENEAAALSFRLSFPVLITRSLEEAKRLLRENIRGESRAGLVGSSGAARLRAEGLEPDSSFHAEYPWDHWYLAPQSDIRSSNQLEVFATEFEIQGLELDWVCLCWGGDFIWQSSRRAWLPRVFRQGKVSKWSETMSDDRKIYRRNAYRVLLTRARQGVVLYVPQGDQADLTRSPEDFDATADFLVACGAEIAHLA